MKRNGATAGDEQLRGRSGSGCRSGAECGMRVVVRDTLRDSLDPTEGWSEDSAMDRKT